MDEDGEPCVHNPHAGLGLSSATGSAGAVGASGVVSSTSHDSELEPAVPKASVITTQFIFSGLSMDAMDDAARATLKDTFAAAFNVPAAAVRIVNVTPLEAAMLELNEQASAASRAGAGVRVTVRIIVAADAAEKVVAEMERDIASGQLELLLRRRPAFSTLTRIVNGRPNVAPAPVNTAVVAAAVAAPGTTTERVRSITGQMVVVPVLAASPDLAAWADACRQRSMAAQARMAGLQMVAPWGFEREMAKWCVKDLTVAAGGQAALDAVADAGIPEALTGMCANASVAYHLAHFQSRADVEWFCRAVQPTALSRALRERSAAPLRTAAAQAGRLAQSYVTATLNERPHMRVKEVTVHPMGKACVADLMAEGVRRPEAELQCGILHDGTMITHRIAEHRAVSEQRWEDLEEVQGTEAELEKLERERQACTDRVEAMWARGATGDRVAQQQAVCEKLVEIARKVSDRRSLAADAMEKADLAATDEDDRVASDRNREVQANLDVSDARIALAYAELKMLEGVAAGLGGNVMAKRQAQVDAGRETVRHKEDVAADRVALTSQDAQAAALENEVVSTKDEVVRIRAQQELATLQQQRAEMLGEFSRRRDMQRIVEDGLRELVQNPNNTVLQGRVRKAIDRLHAIPSASSATAVAGDRCFSCKSHVVMVIEQAQPLLGGNWAAVGDYVRHYCYQYMHLQLGDSEEPRALCETLSTAIANGTEESRFMRGFAQPLEEFCEQGGLCAAEASASPARGPKTPCDRCIADVLGAVDRARVHADKAETDRAQAATGAVLEVCQNHYLHMGVRPQRAATLCSSYAHPSAGTRFARAQGIGTANATDKDAWRLDFADSLGLCEAMVQCSAAEVKRKARSAETADGVETLPCDDPVSNAEAAKEAAAAAPGSSGGKAVGAGSGAAAEAGSGSLSTAQRANAELEDEAWSQETVAEVRAARARQEKQEEELRGGVAKAQGGLAQAVEGAVKANATLSVRAQNVTRHGAVLGALHALLLRKEGALDHATAVLKNRTNKAHELVLHRSALREDEAEAEEARTRAAFDLETMKAKEAEVVDQRVKEQSAPLWAQLHQLNEKVAVLEGQRTQGSTDLEEVKRVEAELTKVRGKADTVAGELADVRERVRSEVVKDQQNKMKEMEEAKARADADRDGQRQDSDRIVALRPLIDAAARAARLHREEARLTKDAVDTEKRVMASAQGGLWAAVEALIVAQAREAAAEHAVLDDAERLSAVAGATGAAAPRPSVALSFTILAVGASAKLGARPLEEAEARTNLGRLLDVFAEDVAVRETGACPKAHLKELVRHRPAAAKATAPCVAFAVRAKVATAKAGELTRRLVGVWTREGALDAVLPAADGVAAVHAAVLETPVTEALKNQLSYAQSLARAQERRAREAADAAGPGDNKPAALPLVVSACVQRVLAAREAAEERADRRKAAFTAAGESADRVDVVSILRNATSDACVVEATNHLLTLRIDAKKTCDGYAFALPPRTTTDDDLPLAETVCRALAAEAHLQGAPNRLSQGAISAARLPTNARGQVPCVECVGTQANMGDRELMPEESDAPDGVVLPSQEALDARGHARSVDASAIARSFVKHMKSVYDRMYKSEDEDEYEQLMKAGTGATGAA